MESVESSGPISISKLAGFGLRDWFMDWAGLAGLLGRVVGEGVAEMMPYDWNDPHVQWFGHWIDHVRRAHTMKSMGLPYEGYCWAACIAQAGYVINLAIKMAKEKNRG